MSNRNKQRQIVIHDSTYFALLDVRLELSKNLKRSATFNEVIQEALRIAYDVRFEE